MGQYYMDGESFVNFLLNLLYIILSAFSDIWGFFTSPVARVIEQLFVMIGLDVDVSNLLDALGLYDISVLGFMFGSGLAIYLTYSLFKWMLQ